MLMSTLSAGDDGDVFEELPSRRARRDEGVLATSGFDFEGGAMDCGNR
jgi:hypothetical protein